MVQNPALPIDLIEAFENPKEDSGLGLHQIMILS